MTPAPFVLSPREGTTFFAIAHRVLLVLDAVNGEFAPA